MKLNDRLGGGYRNYDVWYSKTLTLVKRKPRNKAEAADQLAMLLPGTSLSIFWDKREIGPWRWEGKVLCPLLGREISSGDGEGYDVAHFLMTWFFNRRHEGSGGIARNVYGCIGRPVSYRQELRLARENGDSSPPGRTRTLHQFRAALKSWESRNR